MRILPEPITFVWDSGNRDKNLEKHTVTNLEAEEVFRNKPLFLFNDEKHSSLEKRYMVWGVTNHNRKLTIFFTMRGDSVRIISARDMSRKERNSYEEKIKTHSQI